MREIKFRCWDKSNRLMYQNEDISHITFNKIWKDFVYTKTGTPASFGKSHWEEGGGSECILMQFTGLKDESLQKEDIYDGDILSEKWKARVYQDENTGAFMVKFGTNPKVNKPMTLYSYLKARMKAGCPEDCLVISNVHEDPCA